MEIGGPRRRRFRLAMRRGFEAADGPPPPRREVGDDVFDRPSTGDAGLLHPVFADLSEEAFEGLVLRIELCQKLSLTHRPLPNSLWLTSLSTVSSPAPCASASRPRRVLPAGLFRSLRRARADRSRRSHPPVLPPGRNDSPWFSAAPFSLPPPPAPPPALSGAGGRVLPGGS